MWKKILQFLALMSLLPLLAVPAVAAVPFSAPAVFDLNGGSTLNMAMTVDLGRLGSVDASLDPNPAPVTGFIDIDEISTITGICSGALDDISTQTRATISKRGISLDLVVTVTVSSKSLNGVFIWNQDRVAFYPDAILVTVDINGQRWPISLAGIPLTGTYKDGLLTMDFTLNHQGEYGGYKYDMVLGFHLRGVLKSRPEEGQGRIPVVELKLNQPHFNTGNRLQLMVGVHNSKETRRVDLYLVYFDPEGNYYFAPDYTSRMTPLKTLDLTPYEEISLTRILDVTLPAHTPPIVLAGKSHFCAVLTEAGSTEPLSSYAFADLTFNTPDIQVGGPYDGDWYGSGSSAVPGGACPPLADVTIRIADSEISGLASEPGEDGESYRMTGKVNEKGEIVDGQLLEDYMNTWIVVGSFKGNIVGNTLNGTWIDDYGCYGTFTAEKADYNR